MFAHYINVKQDEVVLHIHKPSMKRPKQVLGLSQSFKQSEKRSHSLQQRDPCSNMRTINRTRLRSNSQPQNYAEVSCQVVRPAFRELVNGYSGQLYFGSTVPYGRQLRNLGVEPPSDQHSDLYTVEDTSLQHKHKKRLINKVGNLVSGAECDGILHKIAGVNDIFQLDEETRSTMASISFNIKRNAIIDGALSSLLNVNGTDALRAEIFKIKVRWPMQIRSLYTNTQSTDIDVILKSINDLLKLLSYATATILDRDQLIYFAEAVIGMVDLRILLLALINLLSNASYTILVLSYITRLFNADIRSRTLIEVYPLLREVTRSFVVPLFAKLAALLSTEAVFDHTVHGRQHIILLVKYLYTMVGLGIISLEESQLLEKADSYNTREWSVLARNLGISQKPGSIVLQRGIQVLRNTYVGPVISGCVADIPSETDLVRELDKPNFNSSVDDNYPVIQTSTDHPLTYRDLHMKLTSQIDGPKQQLLKKPLHYVKSYTISVSVKQNNATNLYLIIWRQPQNKTLSNKDLFMELSSHVKLCRHKLVQDSQQAMEIGSTSEPATEGYPAVSSSALIPIVSSLDVTTEKTMRMALPLPSPNLSPLLSSTRSPPPPPPPPSQSQQFDKKDKKVQRLPTRLTQAAVAEQCDHSCSSTVSSTDKQDPRDRYALSSPTSSTQHTSSKAEDLRLEHLRANGVTPQTSSDSGGHNDPHVTKIRTHANLRGLHNLVSDDDLMRICRADLTDTNLELLTNVDVGSPRTIPHVLIRYNLLRDRNNPIRRIPFKELMNNHETILAKPQSKADDWMRSISTPVQARNSTVVGNDSRPTKSGVMSVNRDIVQLNEVVAQHIVDISLSEVRQRFSKHSLCGTPVYTPRNTSDKRGGRVEHNFCINLSRSTTSSSWRPPAIEKSDQTVCANLISSMTTKLSDLHLKLNVTEGDIQSIQTSASKSVNLRKSMITKSTTNLRKQVFQRSKQHVQSLAEVEAPPRDPIEYFPIQIEKLPSKGTTQVSFDTWGNSDPVFYMLLACDANNDVSQNPVVKTPGAERVGPIQTISTIELTNLLIMRRDKSHPVPDPQFKAPKSVQRNCLRGRMTSDILRPSGSGLELPGLHADSSDMYKNVHDDPSTVDLELFESELLQYLKYVTHKSGDDINLALQRLAQPGRKATHTNYALIKQAGEPDNQKPFDLKAHLIKARAENYELSKLEKTASELNLIVGGHSVTRRHLVRGSDGLMKPAPYSDDILIYYANKTIAKLSSRTPFVETSDQKEASEIDAVEDDTNYIYEDREYSLEEAEDGSVRRHYRKFDQETGNLLCYISESDHGDEDVGQYYQGSNGKAHVVIRVKYKRRREEGSKSTSNHATLSTKNSIVCPVRGSVDSSSDFNIMRFLGVQSGDASKIFGQSIFGLSQAICDEIIKIALKEYHKPKRVTDLADNIFASLMNIASATDEQNVQGTQDTRNTLCTDLMLCPKASPTCDTEDTLRYFGLSPVEARRISRGLVNEIFSSSSNS
ncbi:Hypothetical protein GLP15_3261 [Giardia lamblia P15]|uniref:Uncharacterized protein n=1 Tax=Giardia intestinalis (strain P15) TaxID=658858 RepID=E1EWP1_GIAIA|nr:Hypothetical protein GLP15_3261 [Giardia lamblia P15]